ncbi:MAG: 4-hydroxy-tetrahydrodipicolinate synthase [Erysipelotrichaceae bacterium]|nr:4-hydroxy-tetrahydrodipicolinate synthase [Erysipelotrichaceae bacterium]
MFGKIITAIVTPFDEKKEIDYDSLLKVIKHLEKTHTDSIVVAGTTGEGSTLSFNEKVNLFKYVKEHTNKNIKIIAGIGTNNTLETIKMVKKANKLNVDGYLIVTPYYNKPSQEGIYQHFKAIDNVANKPIIIYNVASRCAVEANFKTIIKLYHDCNHIVGLKHASKNISLIHSLKKEMPQFLIYGGDDHYILDVFKNNGDGIISVISNYYGDEVYELIKDYENGFENMTLYEYLQMISEIAFIESSPAPIKYILSKHDLILNNLRLPLVTLSSPFKQLIDNILD